MRVVTSATLLSAFSRSPTWLCSDWERFNSVKKNECGWIRCALNVDELAWVLLTGYV